MAESRRVAVAGAKLLIGLAFRGVSVPEDEAGVRAGPVDLETACITNLTEATRFEEGPEPNSGHIGEADARFPEEMIIG